MSKDKSTVRYSKGTKVHLFAGYNMTHCGIDIGILHLKAIKREEQSKEKPSDLCMRCF